MTDIENIPNINTLETTMDTPEADINVKEKNKKLFSSPEVQDIYNQIQESREFEENSEKDKEYLLRHNLLNKIYPEKGDFATIDELANLITKEKMEGNWNNSKGYKVLIRKILTYATFKKHEDFVLFLDDYFIDLKTKSHEIAIKDLATKLIKAQICGDIKIAEIGGSYIKELFEKLGAKVDIADAGYDRKEQEVLVDRDQIINMQNYRKFFPDQYDVVCSNRVLESGSGFKEAIKEEGATLLDFYKIEYDLVKDGGIVMNEVMDFSREYIQLGREDFLKLEEYKKTNPKNIKGF